MSGEPCQARRTSLSKFALPRFAFAPNVDEEKKVSLTSHHVSPCVCVDLLRNRSTRGAILTNCF